MAGQILSRSMTNALHAPTGLVNLDHTFTVNGLDQYLTGAGVTFTHDARGSLTYDGTRTYAYDFDNRLTNVTGVGGAVALSYDPAGRLYQTAQSGGATTRFLYDGANLAAEYNGSNVLQKRYVHGPGLDNPIVAYTGTGTSSKVWLIADERGSVLAETNSAGAATQINTYDEYGIPAAGNSGRFGFTGQMWIAEIEAFHYRNRVYHPKLGRFLQTDPIGQAGGLNLYAYVGNDPGNWTDPWGLFRDEGRLPQDDPFDDHQGKGCPFSIHCNSEAFKTWQRSPEALMFAYSLVGPRQPSFMDKAARSVGKIWTLPNTIVGLAYGGAGHVLGKLTGTNPRIEFGNGAIQFVNSPFMSSAMAIGNVVIYAGGRLYSPESVRPLEGPFTRTLGQEEYQHVRQSYVLGPLYLPLHALFGGAAWLRTGSWHDSILEIAPHDFDNRGYIRPWR